MKKYIIIIYNDFIDKELKGEFFCENEEQAIVEAKDFYAE